MAALQVLNGTLVASAVSHNLLESFHSGNLGLSLGIAGFLIPYLAGAAYMLQELGVLTDKTSLAGASSGALTATFLCSGLSQQQFMAALHTITVYCRANRNCQGKLDAAFRSFLEQHLPPDAYKRCSNRVHISISVGRFPPKPGETRNVLQSQFRSNRELIDALTASCFIPVWSSSTAWTTTFLGSPAFDAHLTGGQPLPPLPGGAGSGYVITIGSKTPPWSLQDAPEWLGVLSRGAQVSTLDKQVIRYSSIVQPSCSKAKLPLAQGGSGKPGQHSAAMGAAGFPAGKHRPGTSRSLNLLASASAPQSSSSISSSSSSSSINVQAFHQAKGLDISPGIFHSMCIPQPTWAELLVLPGDEQTNQHLLNLGRADALSWASLTGLADAAARARQRTAEQETYKQGH